MGELKLLVLIVSCLFLLTNCSTTKEQAAEVIELIQQNNWVGCWVNKDASFAKQQGLASVFTTELVYLLVSD